MGLSRQEKEDLEAQMRKISAALTADKEDNLVEYMKPIADEIFKQTYQQLPVISMSVDCFITWCKGQNTPLRDALYFESNGFMHSEQDEERIGGWIADHQDEFARAWLDGYQIDNKS